MVKIKFSLQKRFSKSSIVILFLKKLLYNSITQAIESQDLKRGYLIYEQT